MFIIVKKKKKRRGGDFFFLGGGGNERPGTDHMTSGPIRGLKKTAPDGTDRQADRQTNRVTHGENITSYFKFFLDLGNVLAILTFPLLQTVDSTL